MGILVRIVGVLGALACLAGGAWFFHEKPNGPAVTAILVPVGCLVLAVSVWPKRRGARESPVLLQEADGPSPEEARAATRRQGFSRRMEGVIHSKIRGVAFANDHGGSRQSILEHCSIGEQLRLVRDPHNDHDHNAIRVLRLDGVQLGWIGKDLAADMSPAIDTGQRFNVRIASLTGGEAGHTHGCNIEIEPL